MDDIIKQELKIGTVPAAIYGDGNDKAFIFVHGLMGCKEEAERFYGIARKFGYDVISVDLPEHGKRADEKKLVPWDVIPELKDVLAFANARWKKLSVRATSIGAWFSMQAFSGAAFEKCLFASPLIDMGVLIEGMMQGYGVTKEELFRCGEIPTNGQTLSWRYYRIAKENPARALCADTNVLFGDKDEVIPRFTIDKFVEENGCRLSVMSGAPHWFHTKEQVDFMSAWEEAALSD